MNLEHLLVRESKKEPNKTKQKNTMIRYVKGTQMSTKKVHNGQSWSSLSNEIKYYGITTQSIK